MYAVFYIGFSIISLMFCLWEERQRSYNKRIAGLLIMTIAFSAIIACRPDTIKDTQNYIDLYLQAPEWIKEISSFSLLRKYKGIEWGMILIAYFSNLLFVHFRFMFFGVALLSIILLCWGIKSIENSLCESNSSNYGFVFFFITAYYGLSYLAVAMRMGLALALGSVALALWLKKKKVESIVFFSLMLLIQRTLILAFIYILLFSFFRKGRRLCIGIYMLTGMMLAFNIGELFWNQMSSLLLTIMDAIGVNGFQSFILVGTDQAVGKLDWLIWGIGLCVIIVGNMKCMNEKLTPLCWGVVLMGVIIAFLHGIRAVVRVYDTFICFSVPVLASAYYLKKRLLQIFVVCIGFICMVVMYSVVF